MPTTNYVWDEDNILYETDGANAVTAEYTNTPQYYGNLISEYRNGTTYTHYYDAQGSTLALTDNAGTVTDTFAYTAWGEQLTPDPSTPTPFRWIGSYGYQWDSEIGRYCVRRRHLNPISGRWLSKDPLGFIDGPNQYLYVQSNPMHGSDPSGLETYLDTQVNAATCEVTLNVRACPTFSPGWSDEQILYWIHQFEQQVANAWSPDSIIIKPAKACGPCPGGWHPKSRLRLECVPGAFPLK